MGPDFLYIGCQKAGSRWLYDQLAAHEAFWMPPIKELHYFDGYEGGRGLADRAALLQSQGNPEKGMLQALLKGLRQPGARSLQRDRRAGFIEQARRGDGGRLDLDWYASLFRWKDDRLSGDITPAYSTLSSGMIAVVTARFPDLRCILFVRDPVARAWSQVCGEFRRYGTAPKDWPELQRFLATERVTARSYPSRIFARWSEHVPPERMFVGFFDQLVSEPDVLRAEVLRFLGAGATPPRLEPTFDRKRNQARVPCPPELQRRLVDWFADELQACAITFGGPATQWPLRYGHASANA